MVRLIVSLGRGGLMLMTSNESQMSCFFSASFLFDLKIIFKAVFLKCAETCIFNYLFISSSD